MANSSLKLSEARVQRPRAAGRKNSRGRLAYWMILPAMLGLLVIFFVPMLWGVAISFKTYNKFTLSRPFFQLEWGGFQEYTRAFESLGYGFTQSLSVTLSYTLLTMLFSAALGLGAALVANRKFFGALLFKGVVLLPYILPSVVSLITLRFMLTSDGIINALLLRVGLIHEPVFWLVGNNSFWSILVGSVWVRWPLFYLVFLAGLQTVPPSLYEAATVDGATTWQKFRHITLPYLRSVGAVIILFSSLWSYNDYLTPYVMLGGEYSEIPAAASLLSVEILKQSFNNFSFSYGAAMSILMTLLALLFAFVYLRLARPQALEQGRAPKRSFWTWALAGVVGLFGAFLLGAQLVRIGAALVLIGSVVLLIRLLLGLAERAAQRALTLLGGLFYGFVVLFPVYWLVVSSLKTESDIRRTTLLPTIWAFENYRQVWEQVPLLRYFGNSLGLSAVSMVLAVMVATMAGYAFSRFRFFGRGVFGGSVLATQLFPGVLLLVPFFLIFSTLQNTPLLESLDIRFIGRNVYWGNLGLMLLAYTSAVLPFTIWVMRGYIDSLPADLEEAAEIDGSSRFGAFLRVTVPLAVPGIATIAILAFTRGWNEVLFSSVLTNELTRTVALGIQDFRTEFTVRWNLTMAAGVIISLPVVVFFTFLQRWLVSGLTAGAVKD